MNVVKLMFKHVTLCSYDMAQWLNKTVG